MLDTENLREQVMINQFEMATGCTREQSRKILQASRWEYVTALSSFFQDGNVTASTGCQHHRACPITGHLNSVCAPCNTPATPPNFPDALQALQKMQTSDWSSNAGQQQQAQKILTAFNPMPSPSDNELGKFCPSVCCGSKPPTIHLITSVDAFEGSSKTVIGHQQLERTRRSTGVMAPANQKMHFTAAMPQTPPSQGYPRLTMGARAVLMAPSPTPR